MFVIAYFLAKINVNMFGKHGKLLGMAEAISYYPRNEFSFSDLVLLSCGNHACPPGHKYDGWRNQHVLHHVLSGKGVFKYKRKTYQLGRGDSFLIEPHERNFYQADAQDPWEYQWIIFEGSCVEEVLKHTLFSRSPVVHSLQADAVAEIFSRIFFLASREAHTHMHEIYSCLYQLMHQFSLDEGLPGNSLKLDYVALTKEFIHDHYQSPITTEVIARYLGLNRTYFSHLFKQKAGVGVAQYLRTYRLGKVKELLTTTELSILQAAFSSGFRDYYAFLRLFKRQVGCTPGEFRKFH